MKAEIFYMDGQEDVVSLLGDELRRLVFPGIAIDLQRLTSNQREVIEMGRRYVKLLQASIRPEKGFQLNLTALEHSGYRFYIYVYYAFSYYASTKREQLTDLLPAVALRNRLMLVPLGLGRALEQEPDSQLLSPLIAMEKGGAAEVNFRDRAAVEQAVDQAGRIVKADVLHDVRAYASYRPEEAIDMPALAKDMEVDAGFLHYLAKTQGKERYQQLTCELDRKKLPLDRWTRVTVSIRNDSNETLQELAVRISGPVEIRPAKVEVDVAASSTCAVPIALKPNQKGEFPLEVVLALPDDRIFSGGLPVRHVWIKVK